MLLAICPVTTIKLTEIIGNQLIEIIMHMLQMMSHRK